MSVNVKGREFAVGDKPKPTPFEIKNKSGLDLTHIAATFTAEATNTNQAMVVVPCTNNADGTGQIDWPTNQLIMVEKGTVEVDIIATEGNYITFLGRAIFKVIERN